MNIASSRDAFFDQSNDLKSATGQPVQTLPGLIGRATHERIRGNDQCNAMAGLVEGGNVQIAKAGTSRIRDYLLVAHCTRMGSYLVAAARFTRGIVEKCELIAEENALAEIAERHVAFITILSVVDATAFGLNIGGGR